MKYWRISDWQYDARHWMNDVFGSTTAENVPERERRMLEEAVELCQSGSMDRAMAHKIVDYVFDKPRDTDVRKEAGQLMFVLLSLCGAHEFELEDALLEVNITAWSPERIAKVKANQEKKVRDGL